MSEFVYFAEGIGELDFLDGASKKIRTAAYQAINKVARDTRSDISRTIRQQVNFPARYVSADEKRLYVSEQASGASLQAKITARARATSLARFVVGSPKVGKPGVHVEVAPGKARFLKKAFVIKLPQGSSFTDTKFNLGLAIRLRAGETLSNKVRARSVAKGLYVLYGPSVDQVFRSQDGSGVATDAIPKIERELTSEFLRLLEL
jgi:hypothetical protein